MWFCPELRHEICLISIRFGGVASDKTQRMDFLILFKAFDCSGCRCTWVMACLPESFKLGFGWRVRGFTFFFWGFISDHLADYLDLTFIIDSGGKLSTRLYDKRDDFDFHIVNFPFLSSNIPSGPSYGVYISQLIRYARCCSHYDDFRYRHKCLVDRLLSQGYKALRLEKSFKKFYGRYQDLIEKYRRSVNAMVSNSFPGQFLFNM